MPDTGFQPHPPKTSSLALVIALILLGGLGLFTRWPDPSNVLAPEGGRATFNNLVDFPQKYGQRFNSNFIFRDELIHLEYWTRYFVLRERVFPQVLVGSEDWLYYTGEGNLDYFQRIKPLSEAQIGQIKVGLVKIQQGLEADGIQFRLVVAPNKETIYPEYLPAGIKRADHPSWADQITESLADTSVQVLDLRPVLMQARQTGQVYFKTDTHWNPLGARAAYEAILLALQPDFPILKPHPLDDFDQVTETESGDLAGLIHLKGEIHESFTALHARFEKPSRGLKNPPAGQMITVMPDEKLPKAVIFRDSFFNGLQPFTSEHFSRVVYVSDLQYDPQLVAEEDPDVVILEVAERYLNRLLDVLPVEE